MKSFEDDVKLYPILGRRPPREITKEWIIEAITLGLIPKADLKSGSYYFGNCRNARVALWDGQKNRFTYMRTKYQSVFPEDICHPEDDNGYDVFLPVKEISPSEENLIKDAYQKTK